MTISTDDALADMPPDDGADRVPPLLMAAKLAGVALRRVDAASTTLYMAGKVSAPILVLVRVGRDGYTVRRQQGKRWKTLCKDARRIEPVIKHLKEWT